jgi:hypothetical protein
MDMAMYLKADGTWTSKRSEAVKMASNAQAVQVAAELQAGASVQDAIPASQHCRYCLFMRDLSVSLRADGSCAVCAREGR